MDQNQLLDWAVELQSLAQAGLYYGKDVYDIQRFQRIREISAEMVSQLSGLPLEKVTGLFCCETGYQTPKLDSRAAIIRDGKILLVRENTGLWSLPGGWVDVDQSVKENTIKEAKEEAGLDALECYYPEHTPDMVLDYLDLARRYNLHVSAGSDFHGEKVNPSKLLHPVELETDWLFA